ncbi:hypothetical protein ACJRPK_02670 [Aquimarina sp. 2-A2]|uniref:hypothetical protein n=1 Tax=Aquimarina sp. 2-A2 TaxID=3382644 RepID=UPI00387F1C0E
MNTVDKIYSNEVGMSFYWTQERKAPLPKIQLVFRNTGFLLSLNELKDFSSFCASSLSTQNCNACKEHSSCKTFLLRTPSDKIDLAVSSDELIQIQELINGTIFRIEMKQWITSLCLN